jgi:hypothetical protein
LIDERAYAARFNYDIRKIYEDVKARERTGDHPIAGLRPAEPRLPFGAGKRK